MIKISTHYGHKVSSKMFNDRIKDIVGGNAILSGFQVIKKNDTTATALAGKCIIDGAIIETDEEFDVNVSSSGFIEIVYSHEKKNISIVFSANKTEGENTLTIAEIKSINGIITYIDNCYNILLLSELGEKIEMIESEIGNELRAKETLTSLVKSNNSRLDELEALIDEMIVPAIIDIDYRRENLSLDYSVSKLNK